MARRSPGRPVAGSLLPYRAHCDGADRQHRAAEQGSVYDILFRAAAETVQTIAADPKHLGATIGMTAVLHTWGLPEPSLMMPGIIISLIFHEQGKLVLRATPLQN
jgi:hypothetical protein